MIFKSSFENTNVAVLDSKDFFSIAASAAEAAAINLQGTKMLLANALKLVSAVFCQIFIFSPNDSPPKTMKSAFYFI